MADIVLATLNAKYIHAAFGLRYLLANLGPLRHRACLLEFDINQRPIDVAENLLASNPKIIGLGVYIWNVGATTELVALIKRLRPEIRVILGGPEVSFETDSQEVARLADFVISGEADLAFATLCRDLLEERAVSTRIIPARLPEFSQVALPYALYDERDIAHRIIYVEASRGCPFSCEFCLSSLDIPVRQAPLPEFLAAIGSLLDRGARQLKFVDRTFNLNAKAGMAILEFLLQRYQPGHFFHFEMVPDRLPDQLKEVIARFPPASLQLELGIQTFNPQVAARISRRQNHDRLEENLRFLRQETGVHIHADLIAGLPGETLESFASGFDRLVGLRPHEIQVGILKRLRGAPIARHDQPWAMTYSPYPPYEILQTSVLDFGRLQQLRRFARYWDLVGNSGNFLESAPLIWASENSAPASPFWSFMRWTDWLYNKVGRTDAIALVRLVELLFRYLTEDLQLDPKTIAARLARDYVRGGRNDVPGFLTEFIDPTLRGAAEKRARAALPKRQRRFADQQHLGG